VRVSALALKSQALARFSTVSELLTDLHTRRNGDFGASLAGELAEVRHEQHDLDVLLLFFSRN
jgi:hypothetical protein